MSTHDQFKNSESASAMRRRYGVSASAQRRRSLRFGAAALSAVIAGLYFLIGFNALAVIDDPSGQVFGLFAGTAYALGTALLLAYDRRVLWIVGAALQVFVMLMYFSVAPQRMPNYEAWGITLRVLEALLLVALLALIPQKK